MTENVVNDYGWSSSESPQFCGYIAPQILAVLKQLGVKKVLDLGAGNGTLCSQIASAGYAVVGVEYDKMGVEVARTSHPEIPFYNFGVQDDPAELLAVQVGEHS
ncbi:MAG: methyltransferase domain-containing protein [Methylotenera sp.]